MLLGLTEGNSTVKQSQAVVKCDGDATSILQKIEGFAFGEYSPGFLLEPSQQQQIPDRWASP